MQHTVQTLIVCMLFAMFSGCATNQESTPSKAESTPSKAESTPSKAESSRPQVVKGIMAYMNGEYTEAIRLLEPFARQGDIFAQYEVGRAYTGLKNDAEAVHWYSLVANQGNKYEKDVAYVRYGQYWLGRAYAEGKGVPQDYTQAVQWYHKSADQGVAKAQAGIALAYAKGEGFPKDTTLADQWGQRAETTATQEIIENCRINLRNKSKAAQSSPQRLDHTLTTEEEGFCSSKKLECSWRELAESDGDGSSCQSEEARLLGIRVRQQKAQQERADEKAGGWNKVQVGMTRKQVCELIDNAWGIACSIQAEMMDSLSAPGAEMTYKQDNHIMIFRDGILKVKQ